MLTTPRWVAPFTIYISPTQKSAIVSASKIHLSAPGAVRPCTGEPRPLWRYRREERSGHETQARSGDEEVRLGAAGEKLGDHVAGDDEGGSEIGRDFLDDIRVGGGAEIFDRGEPLDATVDPDGADVRVAGE